MKSLKQWTVIDKLGAQILGFFALAIIWIIAWSIVTLPEKATADESGHSNLIFQSTDAKPVKVYYYRHNGNDCYVSRIYGTGGVIECVKAE